MLNRSVLMGRLTRDPELRRTASGTAVASFTLAVNRPKFKDNAETEVDFIDIVAWRNTAEFVSKWFQKGQLVAVEGRIQVRSYKDKEQNNRKAFEVVADQVHFAESKRDTGYSAPSNGYNATAAPAYDPGPQNSSFGAFQELSDDDGELPF